jgi:hypothetical protein
LAFFAALRLLAIFALSGHPGSFSIAPGERFLQSAFRIAAAFIANCIKFVPLGSERPMRFFGLHDAHHS